MQKTTTKNNTINRANKQCNKAKQTSNANIKAETVMQKIQKSNTNTEHNKSSQTNQSKKKSEKAQQHSNA